MCWICEICSSSAHIVGDELIIRPNTSKTGGGRVVPLRKVVHYIRRHRGALTIPDRWEQRWRALRRAARFRTWRADSCRHTFASYHARYFRDWEALRQEMGHSTPRLLHSRYLSPIQRSVARQFRELSARRECSSVKNAHVSQSFTENLDKALNNQS